MEEQATIKPVGGVKKFKLNTWQIIAIVLLAALIVSVFTSGYTNFGFSLTGAAVIDSKAAASKAVDYINNNVLSDGAVSLVSVERSDGLYLVTVDYNGQQIPVYVTTNGASLFLSEPLNMDQEIKATVTPAPTPTTTVDVVKSDKPKVELFVMSHCPYGTQAEKGILPVAKLLGDEIDFDIKYVYYAMHGEVEVNEQLRQYCIKTGQPDKFMGYLSCFLKEGKSDACLTEVKVDTKKVDTCTKETDSKFKITANLNDKSSWLSGRYPLFNINKADNEKYGVGGSPTLVINGVVTNSARSPAALLGAVCSTFNKQPAECNEKLPSDVPSVGFGYDASGSGSTTGSCS